MGSCMELQEWIWGHLASCQRYGIPSNHAWNCCFRHAYQSWLCCDPPQSPLSVRDLRCLVPRKKRVSVGFVILPSSFMQDSQVFFTCRFCLTNGSSQELGKVSTSSHWGISRPIYADSGRFEKHWNLNTKLSWSFPFRLKNSRCEILIDLLYSWHCSPLKTVVWQITAGIDLTIFPSWWLEGCRESPRCCYQSRGGQC